MSPGLELICESSFSSTALASFRMEAGRMFSPTCSPLCACPCVLAVLPMHINPQRVAAPVSYGAGWRFGRTCKSPPVFARRSTAMR